MKDKETGLLKNTGQMCMVLVADANRDDGFRTVDLGNYFLLDGRKVLLTTLDNAKKYGHLIDVDIYCSLGNR